MRTLGIRTTFSTGMAIFVLVIAVLIPLAVGGASSVITRSAMTQYNSFNKPALSPPGLAVPGGLDHPVHPDGAGFRHRVSFRL